MRSKRTSHGTVVGVFHDRARAEQAVAALRSAGFGSDHISVVTRGEKGEMHTEGSHAGTGAAAGAAAGAGAAALASLGMTFGVIPVIGPILAVGPLAAALISAAGGAAAGGLVGGLIGLGIPEDEAQYYEGEVKSGRVLVTVRADDRADEAWEILHRYEAYNQQHPATATATRATGARGRAAAETEGQTLEVHEEELHATKTPVKKGEVRVRKEVVTEHQQIDVPVEREEVVVERRPVHRRGTATDVGAAEEIRIPVKEEQVHVEKEQVVKEEVHVGKRKVHGTEHVGGTVRKERVKVEEEGDVDVEGDSRTRKGK